MAGSPEGVGDDIGGGGGICGAVCFHFSHEAEGGGLPNGGAGSALDESAGCAPSGEGYGVGQGRSAADYASGGFNVGSVVEQGVERFEVVAAGGPVEGGLGMVHAEGPGIDGRAVGDQGLDCLSNVGEMAGPVGGDVEESSLAVRPGCGQGGVGDEEAGYGVDGTDLDGVDDGRRQGWLHNFTAVIDR